jgi:hypothetical protein
MNTLTAIEAERVLQILRLASDRITILSNIPVEPNDNIYMSLENQVLQNTLALQWQTEDFFRKSNESNNPEMGGKDYALMKKMHRITRNTCRNLLVDRSSLQTLMNSNDPTKENLSNFIYFLNELKSHVHQKLITTVEDEATNRTQLHDLGEKERQADESREALQAKLNEVREEKDKATFGLDQVQRKLQMELQDLNHLNKVETEVVNRDMSEAISKATADHKLRIKQLSDQVDGLERQLSEIMDRNKEEEQRLRKEKNRAELALSTRIQQYDEDMFARQETAKQLETDYKNECKEYAILKEYFDKVDADLFRQAEETDILNAVQRRYEFAMNVMSNACIRIQSIVRAKQARVEVEKIRSKAKKGKKGGKGKKK